MHLPSGYPPPPPASTGVAHGDLGSIPPPPPQPVKKIGKPVFSERGGGDRWGGQEPWRTGPRTITGSLSATSAWSAPTRPWRARVREVPELPEGAGGEDRHSGKGKGFGFVSLMDGGDLRAGHQGDMSGKYIRTGLANCARATGPLGTTRGRGRRWRPSGNRWIRGGTLPSDPSIKR